MTYRRAATLAALVLGVSGALAIGEPSPLPRPLPVLTAEEPRVDPDLFAMPRVVEATRTALGLLQAGDAAGAMALLDRMTRAHPRLGLLQINRAALAMLAGEPEAALEALQAAAGAGASGLGAVLADPLFAPFAGDARFTALVAVPGPPAAAPRPAPIQDGRAVVTAANAAWNPQTERIEPRFTFKLTPTAGVLPSSPQTAAYDLLREHARRGRAAGNHGDLYDNRDRGHSALAPEAHPQLTHVAYAEAARAADVDYGLADQVLFDQITIGNSSTAITGGALWRSLPRLAITQSDGAGPLRLWQNAASNHLYVYPAHKDYGPDMGDLFSANTPYILVSNGSSGSDQPLLEALAMILASFRPDTKARLTDENLVTPTAQMVFRRSLQNGRSRESYFSGDAHPAAFEGYNLNLARMVSLAQSIRPEDIPPQVRIRVVEEQLGVEGIDYFGQGLSEQVFDTPAAVARVWRSNIGRRSMILSAEETRDPNGRPLTFHWRLLQGDPARVTIEPLGSGARARLTVDWHDPFPISDENPLVSSRVDIGVFANNGAHDSAPAILSWHFPPHEARTYVPGPGGAPRIAAIDYTGRPDAYADPMLLPRADWRDVFHYAPDGAPEGWTRTRGDVATEFTAAGARIVVAGEPPWTEPVAYPLRRSAAGALVVEEISADREPP